MLPPGINEALQFLLSLFGFCFIIIEKFDPKLADKVEYHMDTISNIAPDINKEAEEVSRVSPTEFFSKDGWEKRPYLFFFWACLCFGARMMIEHYELQVIMFGDDMGLMMSIMLGSSIYVAIIYSIHYTLKLLNKISGDRALGAIGILMALSDLVLELGDIFTS